MACILQNIGIMMDEQTNLATTKKRLRGNVINFLSRKGFGFIMGEDGVQVFVHYSNIRGKSFKTLIVNEPVEYTCVQGQKGLQAVDVVRLDPPMIEDVTPIISHNRTW